ncbi:MAG: hypothetical protein ACR2P9_06340 [Gammaproteobacteria bacterium]
MSKFINENGTASHSPFAYYDKHLDCIRVRVQDCSVIEKRLSRIFTVFKSAHSEYPAEVGFSIKGITHLFKVLGLPPKGTVKLAHLMDEIVKTYPDAFVKRVREEFKAVIDNPGIEVVVDLNEAA